MWLEDVDVSITGNSTNPTRFQHPVAGTYKKERLEAGKKYFSVASGGGTSFIWYDRYYGKNAFRCTICRFIFSTSSRRNDGINRYG